MSTLAQSYGGAWRVWRQYWITYGGWRSVIYSPYVHVSLALAGVTFGVWIRENWWEQVFSMIPSLLGFSLGGFAIFLGFGNEQFRNLISGRDASSWQSQSPYMATASAFSHFIVIQVLALLIAVLSSAAWLLPVPTSPLLGKANEAARFALWFFGYWLFLYALCLTAATLFAVFRVAKWFDEYRTQERKNDRGTST